MNNHLPGWVWFLTGLAAGVFASFLYYVWKDVPADPEAEAIVIKPNADVSTIEEMQWDFYDIFPKSEVPIVEEYTPDGTKVAIDAPSAYLLQAGSFRNPEDADRLRAELILLGMDVFTRKVETDDGEWTRVLVGPLDTRLEMERERRKLAEANIASIALKVTP
ncbi:MAG: SPOR domain-containing protein [Pseudomonadales bacterium]